MLSLILFLNNKTDSVNPKDYIYSIYEKDLIVRLIEVESGKEPRYAVLTKTESSGVKTDYIKLREYKNSWKIDEETFQIYRNDNLEERQDKFFNQYLKHIEGEVSKDSYGDNLNKSSYLISDCSDLICEISDFSLQKKIQIKYLNQDKLSNEVYLNGEKIEGLENVYGVTFEQVDNPKYFYYSLFEPLPEEERLVVDSVHESNMYRYNLESKQSEIFYNSGEDKYFSVRFYSNGKFVVYMDLSRNFKIFDNNGNLVSDLTGEFKNLMDTPEGFVSYSVIEINKDEVFVVNSFLNSDLYHVDLKEGFKIQAVGE